jgi:hypothetical protein
VDITLRDTTIHPQAISLRQVRVAGDLQDAVIEPMQRARLNVAL